MAASFKDRDRGYNDLLKTLGDMEEPGVLVGLRADTADADVIKYAAANEFGTKHIPERSFLRSTVDKHQEKYLNSLEDIAGVYVDHGTAAGEDALNKLGFGAVADVQRMIVDVREPPNKPATIAAKGSSNPLIDTGRMRQSIDHIVVEGVE